VRDVRSGSSGLLPERTGWPDRRGARGVRSVLRTQPGQGCNPIWSTTHFLVQLILGATRKRVQPEMGCNSFSPTTRKREQSESECNSFSGATQSRYRPNSRRIARINAFPSRRAPRLGPRRPVFPLPVCFSQPVFANSDGPFGLRAMFSPPGISRVRAVAHATAQYLRTGTYYLYTDI
jgi:hypothetical protein